MSTTPTETAITTVMGITGRTRGDVMAALTKNGNNTNRAVIWLMDNDAASVAGDTQRPETVPPLELPDSRPANPTARSLEEQNIQKAIEASLAASSQSVGAGAAPSREDELLSRAIAESLQDKPGFDPIKMQEVNPHDRLRTDAHAHVGLRNVGNTCYVNSLMQTYFHLAILRHAILSFEPAPVDYTVLDVAGVSEDKDTNTIRFAQEMQRLFGFMSLTSRNCVDVRRVMGALLDSTGAPVSMGGQQDAQEFHMLFMSRLEEAFDYMLQQQNPSGEDDGQGTPVQLPGTVSPARVSDDDDDDDDDVDVDDALPAGTGVSAHDPPLSLDVSTPTQPRRRRGDSEMPRAPNTVKALFYGRLAALRTGREADGTPFTRRSPSEYAEIMVQLAPDLYQCLDAYVAPSQIDGYTTPRGHVTQATETTVFEQFPPVLCVQLQRVVYNRAVGARVKRNDPVKFPKYLFMDRYHHRNAAEVAVLRAQEAQLRVVLDSVEQRLARYTSWAGTSMGINDLMEQAMAYVDDVREEYEQSFEERGSAVDPEKHAFMKNVRGFFEESQARESARAERLRIQQARLQAQIEELYGHMKDYPYRLHSVLVHSGGAESGHYWAFIYDPVEDVWRNYNDATVSVVDEAQVWADSIGEARQGTNAYCLFYVDASRDHTLIDPSLTPLPSMIESPKPFVRDVLLQVVPPTLQELVAADDNSLAAEIAEWDAKHASGGGGDAGDGDGDKENEPQTGGAQIGAGAGVAAAEARAGDKRAPPADNDAVRFVAAYEKRLESALLAASCLSECDDGRLESLPAYLFAANAPFLARQAVASQLYLDLFRTRMTADNPAEVARLSSVVAAMGELENGVTLPIEHEQLASMRAEFRAFLAVTRRFVLGLERLDQKNYVQAMQCFTHAYCDSLDLSPELATRAKETLFFARLAMLLVSDAGETLLEQGEDTRALVFASQLAACADVVLNRDESGGDELFQRLAHKWVTIAETLQARVDSREEHTMLARTIEVFIGMTQVPLAHIPKPARASVGSADNLRGDYALYKTRATGQYVAVGITAFQEVYKDAEVLHRWDLE